MKQDATVIRRMRCSNNGQYRDDDASSMSARTEASEEEEERDARTERGRPLGHPFRRSRRFGRVTEEVAGHGRGEGHGSHARHA